MTTIGDVVNYCNEQFHPEYQESYDNAGFLLGCADDECKGVLTAIDLTPDVIAEAKVYGLNLIVTHHPFIFGGLKRITTDSETGRMVYELIKSGISVYAAHTNLDNLKNGVNGILAERLGLTDTHILRPMQGVDNIGAGLVGNLVDSMTVGDFMQIIKQRLGLSQLRCSKLCKERVSRIAICGGAGAFLINDAIDAKADVYVTSDVKYHDFQRAEEKIIIVDAGHYETEQFTKELIYSVVSRKFRTFACRISNSTNSYVTYI